MRKFLISLIVMFLLIGIMGIADATPVSWTYDSVINVHGTEIDNMDGTWTYNFNITNTDTTAIWFANVYTYLFEPYDFTSTIIEWQANSYSQLTYDGQEWNIAGLGDSWFAGFLNNNWPQIALLGIGETVTVGFSAMGQITNPIYYSYWIQNDYDLNRFTAVGIANMNPNQVPEPSTLLIVGAGLAGLGFLRKKTKK